MNIVRELEQLLHSTISEIAASATTANLQQIRVNCLGKKGQLTAVLRTMGALSAEERPRIGQVANEVKEKMELALLSKQQELEALELHSRLLKESIDVTLPGRQISGGHQHPLTKIVDEITDIFLGLGFSVAEGPEVETEYYNFEALNVPPDHPARDMQDSFFVGSNLVLRTQTSPVQIRTMEKMRPHYPVRIISPGKVYRRDDDATHSPMFQQVEGLVIDRDISLAHLKSTLLSFAKQMFGEHREIRLRPSYFPFTEPSAEVDVSCGTCNQVGCRTCKYTGWIEILGCGVVHPKVLRMSGYDPEVVSGFAFGMGVERIAMLKYGIDDLRHFFVNDWRFLKQF